MEINLTNQEQRRYSNQISLPEIGESGQLKIKNAKVVVVGAGGLGCTALQHLTITGIGKLGIIDNELVTEANLYRQVLYGAGDLGKMKTIITREKLHGLNPSITIDIHNLRLTKDNVLKLFSEYDIVIDSSDNLSSSYLINDACVILNKIMVYGAFCKYQGIISVFNLYDSATFRCAFPTPEKYPFFPEFQNPGIIGTTPGIIGIYQANEVIKIITGNNNILSNQLLCINLFENKNLFIPISLNPDNLKINSL
jgi:adenylyltransferase/sulfurtransferase